ncbi:MAG: hydratase [Lachnospiraceae bacterium]|nr:hydratase [Lachnospiraceae bacterium]
MSDAISVRNRGAYLKNGTELIDSLDVNKDEAKKGTIAYGILKSHNTSDNMEKLKIKFDCITSHDITYVGIIQTARASGLQKFPLPYILTNCHNSLCAVGGTINEDDHVFGLTAAKKYGGTYVPPNLAVIHQYAREMLAGGGRMILGSDSHTRYGALGTMAMGEGGPELVKQLLQQTYDIAMPEVVAIYLHGDVNPGVGPQDVAIALIGKLFKEGIVKNKVMEFVGPGVKALSADFRIGIDVMTTETTCLSSIWQTDDEIALWYDTHGRRDDYKELKPADVAYYDNVVDVDLSAMKPMIAMPYHPSCAYTIEEVNANLKDILHEVEERAKISFGDKVKVDLSGKISNGKLLTDQGVIAGCAGGGFENLCVAADILDGADTGNGEFSLSVYPASMPVYMELVRNGAAEKLIGAGAVVKPAFCGPCFGAGDTPSNNAFSIRHSTRNFPNREGSKVQEGQVSSVALMDARSIAATAANKGILTPATDLEGLKLGKYKYHFDKSIYDKRVFDSKGVADSSTELKMGPNIKDWPKMAELTDNLILKVVSEIHDPVTTTDELIPSGETSSYRSNPLRLAEFALSRRDPEYVGRAKAVREIETAREKSVSDGEAAVNADKELVAAMKAVKAEFSDVNLENTGIGSTIFAVKPGDGSAREQAASCQKVLGGWANIANEYATKRYRSNLINWGMLPFVIDGDIPFKNLDYIFVPDIRNAVAEKRAEIAAYVVKDGGLEKFSLSLGELTENEKQIILDGCLINFNRVK